MIERGTSEDVTGVGGVGCVGSVSRQLRNVIIIKRQNIQKKIFT